MTTETNPEFRELKVKLEATWTAGDYGLVARNLTGGARAFFERLDVQPGTHVLDIACGDGQAARPAARSGAKVTGLDLAPKWIEQARRRASKRMQSLDNQPRRC